MLLKKQLCFLLFEYFESHETSYIEYNYKMNVKHLQTTLSHPEFEFLWL